MSQALFGVGILLWGTPALIIAGISFVDTLSILLPISVIVSTFQALPHRSKINFLLLKEFIQFSLPALAIGLLFVLHEQVLVMPFVVFALVLSLFSRLKSFNNFNKKYERYILIFIGLVHGVSNLGGALLVAYISSLKLDKYSHRANVAITYLIFAIIQLIILTMSSGVFSFSAYYTCTALGIYLLVDKLIFVNLSDRYFSLLVNSLLSIIVLFLIFF
jgi:hypothetical protein